VYGRGAIDDKGMLAANLMAFLNLHRRVVAGGPPPERDIVFLATSDEESGGQFGIPWIIERHPQLAEAEFAINEGGRIRIVDGVPRYAAIQTAEKVPFVITMTATGPGGHASMPLAGSAIARLSRALTIVSETRLPLTLSDTTRAFFKGLAAIWPEGDVAAAMTALTSGDQKKTAAAEAVLQRIPKFDALLRNTLAPAVVNAGTRHNVIPASAQATLSLRMLPGQRPEDVVDHMTALIDDPNVVVSIQGRGRDAPASAIDSPMFRAMEQSLAALDPNIVAVPYLSAGATESAWLRAAGIQCCGILPFPLDDETESRMHGADECLPISSFDFGVRFLTDTLMRIAY
jgi:acetylornithine deacetylase/succinyl-diaminopimelate desuccinylase-like protein